MITKPTGPAARTWLVCASPAVSMLRSEPLCLGGHGWSQPGCLFSMVGMSSWFIPLLSSVSESHQGDEDGISEHHRKIKSVMTVCKDTKWQ